MGLAAAVQGSGTTPTKRVPLQNAVWRELEAETRWGRSIMGLPAAVQRSGTTLTKRVPLQNAVWEELEAETRWGSPRSQASLRRTMFHDKFFVCGTRRSPAR